MKRFCWVLVLPLCFCAEACRREQSLADKQKEIETGNLDRSFSYTAEEIGWSVQVPDGWDVMTRDATKALQEKGKKIIEETAEAQVDASGLKQLLNLRKDPFNNLLSTMEPYDEAANGPWQENNNKVFELVLSSYAQAEMKIGRQKQGVETLDGLEFQTWEVEVLRPSGKGVLIVQKMYSRHISGYDFGVTLTTNNEADRALLEKVVHDSKFTKRGSSRD